jgi:hypothetical protein
LLLWLINGEADYLFDVVSFGEADLSALMLYTLASEFKKWLAPQRHLTL